MKNILIGQGHIDFVYGSNKKGSIMSLKTRTKEDELLNNIIEQKENNAMTQAEMLQFQMINLLFDKLQNLTDRELMTRKQIEIELGHNLRNVNKEMNRRTSNV